jgi:hypothetical protein
MGIDEATRARIIRVVFATREEKAELGRLATPGGIVDSVGVDQRRFGSGVA